MIKNISVSHNRAGLTLVEVVFAIGVILLGLVGLTAILPLAGHRAQDSLDFDTGTAISTAIVGEIQSRDLLREPNVAAQRPIIRLDANRIRQQTDPPPSPLPTTPPIVVPFCFDPMLGAVPPASPGNSYTPNVFPYYAENHNPFHDPAQAASTGTALFADQPRLQRVKLNPLFFAAGLTGPQELEIARTLVESVDDLPQLRASDRSIPSVLTGLTAVGSGVPFGASVPTGAYSWMITVDPDPTTNVALPSATASMSVVVFRSREVGNDFPDVTAAGDTTEPRANAVSERIALVVERTGFQGGAGGSVRLMSSSSTLSSLVSNDWIMLSRNTGGGSDQSLAVHRWYRVVNVDREAEMIESPADTTIVNPNVVPAVSVTVPVATLAGSGTNVWARDVLLDGPDWDFTSDASGNFYTYATIVRDVVSVKTTKISLADF